MVDYSSSLIRLGRNIKPDYDVTTELIQQWRFVDVAPTVIANLSSEQQPRGLQVQRQVAWLRYFFIKKLDEEQQTQVLEKP